MGRLVEWIKLSPRHLLPLSLFSGFLLFAPQRWLAIEDFSEEPKAIEFGTAAGGGYSVEFGDDTPYGGEGRNIGLYFLQGGFGVVFPTNENGFRNAQLVRAKNPAFWVLETGKRFGHGISSMYLFEDHCGIAGEELLQAGRYIDALRCYELRKDSKSLPKRPSVYDRYVAGHATAMFNCGRPFEAIEMLATHLDKYRHSPYCERMLEKMLRARENRPLCNSYRHCRLSAAYRELQQSWLPPLRGPRVLSVT